MMETTCQRDGRDCERIERERDSYRDELNKCIDIQVIRKAEADRDEAVAQVGELSRELEKVHAALIVEVAFVPPLAAHAERMMRQRGQFLDGLRKIVKDAGLGMAYQSIEDTRQLIKRLDAGERR